MANLFYGRVSSKDQNPNRQIDALKTTGVHFEPRNIFVDKESGKDFNRDEYLAFRRAMRPGDVAWIEELDRFGRNKKAIMREWQEITAAGVDIVILESPLLDTRRFKNIGIEGMDTLITDIVLTVLASMAEMELKKNKKRQREGIDSARRHGTKSGLPFGRPRAKKPPGWDAAVKAWKAGSATAADTWRALGLTKSTFYKLTKNGGEA